jgi:hypothetical protein
MRTTIKKILNDFIDFFDVLCVSVIIKYLTKEEGSLAEYRRL